MSESTASGHEEGFKMFMLEDRSYDGHATMRGNYVWNENGEVVFEWALNGKFVVTTAVPKKESDE